MVVESISPGGVIFVARNATVFYEPQRGGIKSTGTGYTYVEIFRPTVYINFAATLLGCTRRYRFYKDEATTLPIGVIQ